MVVDAAIHAIAEPRRRAILRLVWAGELPAGEIAAHFAVTRPAISQHLRVLKDAGLVTERRQGTRRLYHAVPERMGEVRAFLEEFWDDQLNEPQPIAAAESHEQTRWQRMKLRPG
jgi:DNA-binding transcriptional ArsR family regulator